MEILQLFLRAISDYGDALELTIVSPVDIPPSGEQIDLGDVARAKHIIESNREWIHYYPSLPNQEVLRLAKESHIRAKSKKSIERTRQEHSLAEHAEKLRSICCEAVRDSSGSE